MMMIIVSIHDNDNRRTIDESDAEIEEITRQFRNINSIFPSLVVNNQMTEENLRSAFRAICEYFNELYHHENDDGDVLKYLKTRTHHTPAEDVKPEICAICQYEYKHKENIGALQCRHEYHTDCIKQWLLKKKDCPMCRASALPAQEQRF